MVHFYISAITTNWPTSTYYVNELSLFHKVQNTAYNLGWSIPMGFVEIATTILSNRKMAPLSLGLKNPRFPSVDLSKVRQSFPWSTPSQVKDPLKGWRQLLVKTGLLGEAFWGGVRLDSVTERFVSGRNTNTATSFCVFFFFGGGTSWFS